LNHVKDPKSLEGEVRLTGRRRRGEESPTPDMAVKTGELIAHIPSLQKGYRMVLAEQSDQIGAIVVDAARWNS